jgi:hypothetical protein
MNTYLAQVSWSGRSWIVSQKVRDARLGRHKHDRYCSVRVPFGQARALEHALHLATGGRLLPNRMLVLRDTDIPDDLSWEVRR